MNDKSRQTSFGWVAGIALALLVLYPLSFGPACWLTARMTVAPSGWISQFYAPLLWGFRRSPLEIKQLIRRHACFGSGATFVHMDDTGQVRFLDPVPAPRPKRPTVPGRRFLRVTAFRDRATR